MFGPYPLDGDTINSKVEEWMIGNYWLGYIKNNKFIVQYVGRSDADLQSRLLDHTGEKYPCFMFCYAKSAKEAYEKECIDYHRFGENDNLDNDIHPDCPDGERYICPVCKQ